MANEINTTSIAALLEETEATGLVTQETIDAFEAERLQAKEQIRDLRKSQKEGCISLKDMKIGIETIQQ